MFVLASVSANHKTTTEADVLNKIAGQNEGGSAWGSAWGSTLLSKVVLGSWKDDKDQWDWIFEYWWIWTALCENGSHYGTTIQFCSNFPNKYTTLKSIIKLASKQVGFP